MKIDTRMTTRQMTGNWLPLGLPWLSQRLNSE